MLLDAYSVVRDVDCAYYDALYVALSRRLDLPLITADRRLFHRIHHFRQVIWLGNYDPSA